MSGQLSSAPYPKPIPILISISISIPVHFRFPFHMTELSPPAGLLALAGRCAVVRDAACGPGAAPTAPALLDRAALHVLDWLACAAQGSSSTQGQVFGRWLALQTQGPAPTLAGRSTDAASAAAYHGALGSALEMDDVHRSSVLHPGPVVIPAALAAAFAPLHEPAAAQTGAQWLSALVVGYEAMIRVGRCLGPAHYRHWHTTSTAGSFGAAAAVAAVWNLDEPRMAHAMALAGTRAGGLWQVRHESSLAKSWHMAGAARDGVTAAQLAACGLTGPLAVLEGPSGWLAATAGGAGAITIDEAQDRPWLEDVSFKPWPACRHAHAAMDALAEALSSAPGPAWLAADIDCIDVHTYANALRFCDRAQPTDSAQARFSIQHALAAWCLWGPAKLLHYEGASLTDAAVQALRARVRLHLDANIESRYPQHYGARVVLHRHGGAQHTLELQNTRGDPARPLPLMALQDKARMLMAAGGWLPSRIDAALVACAGLPQASDLSALRRVLMP